MLNETPEGVVEIVAEHEAQRFELCQLVTVDGESQDNGLNAGLAGEFRVVESGPCPVPGLAFQRRRVEAPSEVGVRPADMRIDTVGNDRVLVVRGAAVPQLEVATLRYALRGGRVKERHGRPFASATCLYATRHREAVNEQLVGLSS
jgi:hypothetical protein